MSFKWVGAMLVMLSCGGCGWSIAAEQRRQEKLLHQLMMVLSYMECELRYRLTPLPDLCRQAGREASGVLGQLFEDLGTQLDGGSSPDALDCMKDVLSAHRELPICIRRLLYQLGRTLGRFDLPGQLQGLAMVQKACRREDKRMAENRRERMRNVQTLGFCAGAALVILFV